MSLSRLWNKNFPYEHSIITYTNGKRAYSLTTQNGLINEILYILFKIDKT